MKKCLVLLTLVLATIPALSWAETTPHIVVESYFHFLERGDTEGALRLVSEKFTVGMRDQDKQKLFEKMINKIRQHSGIDSIDISDQKSNDSVAIMHVTILFEDKTIQKKRMSAKKLDGKWKLTDL